MGLFKICLHVLIPLEESFERVFPELGLFGDAQAEVLFQLIEDGLHDGGVIRNLIHPTFKI